MKELTPMMKQYFEIKDQYKDEIVLYRLGDFYEMFFDDAIIASKELELTLTGRDCGQDEKAPMCGMPYHSVDSYISRLIAKGYKVVICEQIEDPAEAKGIVKRGVVRIVTPGTIIESNMLDEKKNNYIASIYVMGLKYAVAFCDVSTGEFYVSEIDCTESTQNLIGELSRISPAEIVCTDNVYNDKELISNITGKINTYISKYNVYEDIKVANKVEFNSGFAEGNIAARLLFNYIIDTQKGAIDHINHISYYNIDKCMILDSNTRRNLELTETMRDKSKKGTLLWVLDKTNTSMGGRNIRKWIEKPLNQKADIELRLEAVAELKEDIFARNDIIDELKQIHDIERIISRIVYGNTNARDLIMLKNSLERIPNLKNNLSDFKSKMISNIFESLDVLEDVVSLINNSIDPDAGITIKEGGIIKSGYNGEVDKLREATTNGKNWLLDIENKERESTGIKNIKVGYNRVFGYFLDVTKSYQHLVPDRYIRKQTLSNAERYITEELKELEDIILTAQTKVMDLEYKIFCEIRQIVSNSTQRIQKTALEISVIDTLCSFAQVAENNQYTCPKINEDGIIEIKNGRHPVVEKCLTSDIFVPNDTLLDNKENNFNMITGPNMAGKSTYMRQVAQIVLMMQIGSFVPADSSNISIVDRIFTRVGASDDLAMGQSTFMVEMVEVANILKNATENSLVILDEIGRGTSTYDGLSIAWAVTEYITSVIKAKTLFATHYHELTDLEEKISGVKNYSIDVIEKGENIIFLHKIINQKADGSYGIHVASLAGVPKEVTKRANEILREVEVSDISRKNNKPNKNAVYNTQFDMFNYKLGEIERILNKTDLNNITPIEAFSVLSKLKEKL